MKKTNKDICNAIVELLRDCCYHHKFEEGQYDDWVSATTIRTVIKFGRKAWRMLESQYRDQAEVAWWGGEPYARWKPPAPDALLSLGLQEEIAAKS